MGKLRRARGPDLPAGGNQADLRQHVEDLAAVGAGVDPNGGPDRGGNPRDGLEAGKPRPRRGRADGSEGRAAAGGEVLALDLHPQKVPLEAHHHARETGVRDEDVRPHAEQRERQTVRGRRPEDAREGRLGPDAAEPAGRAADLPGRVRRERLVRPDAPLFRREREIHGQ